ncbi:MAG TPA: NlpC/P60 family protein [Sphingomicrobium sp.]|jgi:murein DD-endopeptidase / murein LD-carboxypeptidase|nr:NlpC/P60 family protein [Sphingomicrobium sp.]
MTIDYAGRARALVGTRFRAQGRTPSLGLDCVGLVICAFGLPERTVRRDYRLRGDHLRELLDGLAGPFRRVPPSRRRPGDVVVLQVGRDQLHLGILTDTGFVHADARLGKVVETGGVPQWPILAHFRRRRRNRRGR